MNNFEVTHWDLTIFNWFVFITAFCNIITLVTLMGRPDMMLSRSTEWALSLCALSMGLVVIYFKFRLIGWIGGKKK